MSDFKVIETQEQLDALIGERIKRAKESAEKKYEGWTSPDDLKAITEGHSSKLEELNNSLKVANEKIANHDKEIADRDGRIAKYELDSVKTRACVEYGIPLEMAGRLQGANEEEIMKDASALSSYVGVKTAPPMRNPEAKIEEDGVMAAFKKLNPNINF